MAPPDDPEPGALARSFNTVSEAYARSRPSYPPEAVDWLTGPGRLKALELGAGTGLLTRLLIAAGHDVLATDPAPEMLARLREGLPRAQVAVANAETIPVPSRTVDVVVCAQSFHWFDHTTALPEIARVLRPGGRLGLVWNLRDDSIPWVRRLNRLIGGNDTIDAVAQAVAPLEQSGAFGLVESAQFRFWQTHNRSSLLDLVRSRSVTAVLDPAAQDRVLAGVAALYDDYGRGPDGMRLPYLTRCYRATVLQQEPVALAPRPDRHDPAHRAGRDTPSPGIPDDPGATLIDFR